MLLMREGWLPWCGPTCHDGVDEGGALVACGVYADDVRYLPWSVGVEVLLVMAAEWDAVVVDDPSLESNGLICRHQSANVRVDRGGSEHTR